MKSSLKKFSLQGNNPHLLSKQHGIFYHYPGPSRTRGKIHRNEEKNLPVVSSVLSCVQQLTYQKTYCRIQFEILSLQIKMLLNLKCYHCHNINLILCSAYSLIPFWFTLSTVVSSVLSLRPKCFSIAMNHGLTAAFQHIVEYASIIAPGILNHR